MAYVSQHSQRTANTPHCGLFTGYLAQEQGALCQEGAQGAVFVVKDDANREAVAVKRIPAHGRRAQRNEIRAVSTLLGDKEYMWLI